MKRLHSSNFGRISTATEKADLVKLAQSLTRPRLLTSAPTGYGKKYEGKALEEYSLKMGTTVEKSGSQVSCTIPYLGCSPDGLVGTAGIVEAKCP
ncbi:hypothetical protein LSH36_97g07084 [Paralvinella palmiformis]|uniref:YqaJ viral recombinase domain-containing protein n=1 Tax=Paralvinella palmiformis TaxID=53620 RepID=A0AAD9K082_9ANNE|nr:hypothetical protein LSH36_97g07084 [Paralvinella palmiformis]